MQRLPGVDDVEDPVRLEVADAEPAGALERPTAWLLRNPLRGAVAGLIAVVALTGVALVAGPPVG